MSENESHRQELFFNNLSIVAEKLNRDNFEYYEWKLLEGIEFGDIDLSREDNSYQLELIHALLSKHDGDSMFSSVVKQVTAKQTAIEKVEFKKLRIDDLGKGLGTKREVDLLDPGYTVEQIGEEKFRHIAYLSGYAMGEPVAKAGCVVKDSNPLNLIVGEENEQPFVRYCDSDAISGDSREMALEFRLLRPRFGQYAKDFDDGIRDAKQGKERKRLQ